MNQNNHWTLQGALYSFYKSLDAGQNWQRIKQVHLSNSQIFGQLGLFIDKAKGLRRVHRYDVLRKRETWFPDGHLGFPVLLDSEGKRTQSTTRDVTPLILIIKAAKLFFVLLARAHSFLHIFTLKEKHSVVFIGNNKVPSDMFLLYIHEANPSVAIYIHGCGLTHNESVGSCPDLFGSWATMTLCSQDFNMKQEYQQKYQQNIILLVF